MNLLKLTNRLDHAKMILPQLVVPLDDDDAQWKPSDDDWSVLEVVRHLVDEEIEDFRTRVQMTFHDPSQTWPAIDPAGAAVERQYNTGHVKDAVARFVVERTESVRWLRAHHEAVIDRIDRRYEHPKLGPIALGDLVAAWVAHDSLHLRQIAKRLFQLAQRDSGVFSTDYAGTW